MVVAHATNDDNYLEIPDMHSHWLIVLPGETIRDLDFPSPIQKTQKSSKTMDQMKLENRCLQRESFINENDDILLIECW